MVKPVSIVAGFHELFLYGKTKKKQNKKVEQQIKRMCKKWLRTRALQSMW